MSEKSGFFNATETSEGVYDKVYDAEDFAQYFALFVGNGVFLNPSNQLKVEPKTGLTVTVKAGKAFIDGYWYELDEDMDITLSANGTSNAINDVIVCTLNKSTRTISTVKKENVSSVLPVNNGTIHELVLAIVSIGVGVSSLTVSNITDTRPDNTYCGFVGALIEQVDFGNLFNQMESQFNDWFNDMKGQLTEDAAGKLQIQVNDKCYRLDSGNLLISDTDLNNVRDTGNYYYVSEVGTVINAPPGVYEYKLKVENFSDYVIQRLIDNKGLEYVRTFSNNVWAPWIMKVGGFYRVPNFQIPPNPTNYVEVNLSPSDFGFSSNSMVQDGVRYVAGKILIADIDSSGSDVGLDDLYDIAVDATGSTTYYSYFGGFTIVGIKNSINGITVRIIRIGTTSSNSKFRNVAMFVELLPCRIRI